MALLTRFIFCYIVILGVIKAFRRDTMRFTMRGAFFILANIISAIAVLIPFYIFSIEGSYSDQASMSLLYNGDNWYWYGIIVLLADIAGIIMVLAGFRKPLAIIALANVVTSVYAVIWTNLTKTSLTASMRILMKFSEGLTGSKSNLVVTNGPGYYLIILALFMVLVTGLWAAFERD